jgi:hypothetical protein
MEIVKFLRIQWDRMAAVIAAIVGVVALVVGYFGISGTPHVAAQLPYIISGGMFGLFALGIAGMAWISADLRDEWRELRGLRELIEEERPLAQHGISERPASGTNPAAPAWSEPPSRATGPESSSPMDTPTNTRIGNGDEAQPKLTVPETRRSRTRTRPLRASQTVDDAERTPER